MLIHCHECGCQVSTEARACPQCGAPPKRPKVFQRQANEPTDEDFVSFENAVYRANCPICERDILIKGKTLASKESVKCPHLHLGQVDQLVSVVALKNIRIDTGRVIYRRIKDFFSYQGRLSVSDYWLSLVMTLPIIMFVKIASFGFPLIFFGLLHPLWIKRYHDQGMSGNWVAIQGFGALTSSVMFLLLPEVVEKGRTFPAFGVIHGLAMIGCLGTGLMLSFAPGKSKINRYGPPKSEVERTWL